MEKELYDIAAFYATAYGIASTAKFAVFETLRAMSQRPGFALEREKLQRNGRYWKTYILLPPIADIIYRSKNRGRL